jgi:hypothetical protein
MQLAAENATLDTSVVIVPRPWRFNMVSFGGAEVAAFGGAEAVVSFGGAEAVVSFGGAEVAR